MALIAEYLTNMRTLLSNDTGVFRLAVERQVQGRLLPRIAGPRADLEPELWELLIFCLDGHEASAPDLDDSAVEKAQAAAKNGAAFSGEGNAAFPKAARAVFDALLVVREVGVYPRPTLS